jgi:DNA-directed RNA polymerase subunit RPC12/RpoP
MAKKKQSGWFLSLERKPEDPPTNDSPPNITLQPALRQIGTTDCPICKHDVAVFLTKTHRPFINCGFCSARIFYNGRESMRRLKRNMTEVAE